MAIPKIKEQDIIAALKYIDENGVPSQNQSTKYELVMEDGKKYPPKYVIAVARHLATGEEIVTSDFNAVEAKSFLQGQGYTIETKQEKFELTISAESVASTDERFTMDNLSLGDNYKPLNAFLGRPTVRKSNVTTTRARGGILTRPCRVSPVRCLRNSWPRCPLKARRVFLSASTILPAKRSAEFIPALMNSKSIGKR